MLKPAAHYRLNWKAEIKKLRPYMEGRGGVVAIEYASEDAAPEKFNYLLKEDFGKPGNGMWNSMRIDHEWYTTRRAEGILDELDRLLGEAGFAAEGKAEHAPLTLLSENTVKGNMTVNMVGVVLHGGYIRTDRLLRARVKSVCGAMRRYVDAGGHFMIVVNDAPISNQATFWREIWNDGLSHASGDNVLLIIHAGPKAGRLQHSESPSPDEVIYLPSSVESDDSRQDDIYDDLFTIFEKEGFHEPAECAAIHLSNNKSSIRQLHVQLSAAIMNVKKRTGEQKA